MNFLILYKTGPGVADLEVCDVIFGKKSSEAEEAMLEAMVKGEGEYVAVPFDKSKILHRKATPSFRLDEVKNEESSEDE